MTKAILTIDESSNLMFDCIQHADDHDACTIMSALCNVLVVRCFDVDREPTVYNKGHVRIDIANADKETITVFQTVYKAMQQAGKLSPGFIRIY